MDLSVELQDVCLLEVAANWQGAAGGIWAGVGGSRLLPPTVYRLSGMPVLDAQEAPLLELSEGLVGQLLLGIPCLLGSL